MQQEIKNNLTEFHRNFVRDFENSDKSVMRLGAQEVSSLGVIQDVPMPILEGSLMDGVEQAHIYGDGLIREWQESAKKSGMDDLDVKIISCSIPVRLLFDCPTDMEHPENWVWQTTAFLTSDSKFCIIEIVEPGANLTHMMTVREPFWFYSEGDMDIPEKVATTYPEIIHNKKNIRLN